MNKPWLSYFSSLLLLLAGVLMIAGAKTIAGIFFIVLSVLGLVVKFYMNKNSDKDQK